MGITHKVFKEQLLYPYNVQPVQGLLQGDFDARLKFCLFIRKNRNDHISYHRKIYFTVEISFTRRGLTNSHNAHVYAIENLYVFNERHFYYEFRMNV